MGLPLLGLLDKAVAGVFTSDMPQRILDAVEKRLPAPLTPEQRLTAERELMALENDRREQAERSLNAASAELSRRIAELEGTASDLLSLPVLGRVMLFLRGAQRPAWGFAVLWMDLQVYSGTWKVPSDDTPMQSAFWVINFLVLGFLFSERALANVLPLAGKYFGRE